MKRLDNAITLAAVAHGGQYDRGGKPYILHCIHVMQEVEHLGESAMICAILHDALEDTDLTVEDLRVAGLTKAEINVILTLTHTASHSYEEYIQECRKTTLSRLIKMADLRHNSDITRLKGVREKDFERMKKYHKAYRTLQGLNDTDS